ncbi:hypothetical protein [Nostoc sp. FACHB-152]|nr:hypothetical protein [Nostoc sp. FACHB-152]
MQPKARAKTIKNLSQNYPLLPQLLKPLQWRHLAKQGRPPSSAA